MKLYYMPGACSLATHILLRESGESVELDRVARDKKTESGKDFLAINPKGYVPAVELDDGDLLTENVVIHNYIADRNPASNLAPAPGTKARLKHDELAVYITTEVHKTFGGLFNPAATEDQKTAIKDKLATRYAPLELRLADGRTYLNGDTFSTVDAYLFTVTNWSGMTGVDLSAFPKLMAFQARVAARPAVYASLVAEGLVKAA